MAPYVCVFVKYAGGSLLSIYVSINQYKCSAASLTLNTFKSGK